LGERAETAGEKSDLRRSVSGHDFSRADELFKFSFEPALAGGTTQEAEKWLERGTQAVDFL
jgi:hypothetical protein